ncbi:MAG TPA: alpha,alpha-trehalase TreF [Caulobacteraceae bacterium]|nr:alpha,alpha-trehalase TreF [Caulobacteraceae bacterium]
MKKGLSALAALLLCSGARAEPAPPPPPSALFGRLYADVELRGLFPDSKTFADAQPLRPPAAIIGDYRRGLSTDQLRAFVAASFEVPSTGAAAPPVAPSHHALKAHIAVLWPVLARAPLNAPAFSSQLSLGHPYVVPGGRFREVYYWDSYFTMLGLVRDGRSDLAIGLADDFADLIARYGHVPNGARTYYLSRSQPPVFYLMAGLTRPEDPAGAYAHYLDALRREHRFWMAGEDRLKPGQADRHVVRLPDGSILNRYWDARATPRDEAWREDVAMARSSGRPPATLYRELRSTAESGWDFSSRWMADGRSLSALRTTAIAPVDLNSLLFGLEGAIAEGCARLRDVRCVGEFTRRAARRRQAMDRYLWRAGPGIYLDYDWRRETALARPSAAMLYPLFVGAASRNQAERVAVDVRTALLAPGGLRTTTVRTGQQWDAPNGWAPLQWIAVGGLERYGDDRLARDVAGRWLSTVCRTYRETGKLLEKYDVEQARPGGGGEYPLQDGFGWTNGVTRALLDRYQPDGDGGPDCAAGSEQERGPTGFPPTP